MIIGTFSSFFYVPRPKRYPALKQLVLGDYLDAVGQSMYVTNDSHHSEWISGVVRALRAARENVHGGCPFFFTFLRIFLENQSIFANPHSSGPRYLSVYTILDI